jgi:hypothetical protein
MSAPFLPFFAWNGSAGVPLSLEAGKGSSAIFSGTPELTGELPLALRQIKQCAKTFESETTPMAILRMLLKVCFLPDHSGAAPGSNDKAA